MFKDKLQYFQSIFWNSKYWMLLIVILLNCKKKTTQQSKRDILPFIVMRKVELDLLAQSIPVIANKLSGGKEKWESLTLTLFLIVGFDKYSVFFSYEVWPGSIKACLVHFCHQSSYTMWANFSSRSWWAKSQFLSFLSFPPLWDTTA